MTNTSQSRIRRDLRTSSKKTFGSPLESPSLLLNLKISSHASSSLRIEFIRCKLQRIGFLAEHSMAAIIHDHQIIWAVIVFDKLSNLKLQTTCAFLRRYFIGSSSEVELFFKSLR